MFRRPCTRSCLPGKSKESHSAHTLRESLFHRIKAGELRTAHAAAWCSRGLVPTAWRWPHADGVIGLRFGYEGFNCSFDHGALVWIELLGHLVALAHRRGVALARCQRKPFVRLDRIALGSGA